MNTSEALVDQIERLGIERVFGYPGGRIIEVFDLLPQVDVDVVRPRDEREASVMAEAHGRITGQPAVLAGQGPWIGSLGLIGQMEARLGSSPMLILTEASERGDYSTMAPYQQSRGDYGGLDLPGILDGVTKEHWFPRSPSETIRSFHLAYKHATAGRPGPTAVVLDGDAVTEEVPDDPVPPLWDPLEQTRTWTSTPTDGDVAAAAGALANADRPVVVAGNGIHAAEAYEELQRAAETYEAVVVTTYLGKSTIPETHPLAGGIIGSFGQSGANHAVSEADVLLVVGSRLNPMDANWNAPSWIRPDEQTIIHADVDPRNAGWVYPADVGLVGDAGESLRALVDAVEAGDAGNDWAYGRAAEAKHSFDAPACESDAVPIKPQRAVKEIDRVTDENTLLTADSGNNRFWLSNYVQTEAVGTYYGSGGVGGMGWAAPAAVAAALCTDKDVLAVAGDGGFAMTMTAVETAIDEGVAPGFAILNDTSLGMVRQMESKPGDIAGTEFHDTDFVKIAKAMGATGTRIRNPADLAGALEDAKASDIPVVVDIRIDREEDMAETLASSFYDEIGGLHE
jgi:acetolactate synthase-1/2/3 large subunit